MVKFLLRAICIFIVVNVQAQTISVGAYTDTTDYLVGDFINYEIEVVTRKNIEVIAPSFPDSLTQLELITSEEPVSTEDEKSQTTIYKFIKGQHKFCVKFILKLKPIVLVGLGILNNINSQLSGEQINISKKANFF